MADQNSYLRYKRDTRDLLYWMIHASNSIIKSSVSVKAQGENASFMGVNTTGQLTVSALVPVSKLIAEHVNPIPSTIYRLFQSVIDARKATHAVFEQIVSKKPDPEIEKSNISHKHFIDSLTEAFETLGGKVWASKLKSENERPDEEDREEVIFLNQFSALNISESNGAEEGEDEGSDGPSTEASSARPKKKVASKGKKGKIGKKGKKRQPAKEPSLDEVPLESYRIIEDESGLVTDYLMAVYSLVRQWIELRDYVQGLWHEVAYENLNSAVAGAMSNIAIAMVKKTQSAIFVDFPGHDSYETVMKTITRGNVDKAQGMFSLTLHKLSPDGNVVDAQEKDIDVKEQFLIHAYQNLFDFITDFQKTRSGKPTKPMMAEIRDWDPYLNLQRASKQQRIKWRRSYTINWLYDLVNIFSSIVVQRNTMKGQHWVYETVDWSVHGPWNKHRRLFGLNEFAGDITTLAMQKPGTDIRQRILPHHVLQMQCIVDSLTVSRGWSLSNLHGHILSPPAPGFRPRRDVDLFLDRENQRIGHGYLQSIDLLKQLLDRDAQMHGDPNRHVQLSELLEGFQFDFVNWLGESKYMHGLKTIPPSRFSNSNANGLWEYSPFLCGVGLAEGLEAAYDMSFLIWDRIPEPMCIIHLHNMLVKKGYIEQEIGLYSSLQSLFNTAFFSDGKEPTSDFHEAFLAVCSETGSRRAKFQRRAISRGINRTAVDLYGLLDLNRNRFFTNKSLLRIYREAEWVPDRISDEDVEVLSALGTIRISQTKVVTDSTDKRVMEDTPLTRRARAIGLTDDKMLELKAIPPSQTGNQPIPAEVLASIPDDHTVEFGGSGKGVLEGTSLLSLLKGDMVNDISGEGRPLSSLNYTFVTARFMMLFMQIEDRLKELRNPLWVRAYEEEPVMMREKRVSLTALALAEQDDECLRVMAEEFENPRTGWITHIYWEDLDDMDKVWGQGTKDKDAEPSCSVM